MPEPKAKGLLKKPCQLAPQFGPLQQVLQRAQQRAQPLHEHFNAHQLLGVELLHSSLPVTGGIHYAVPERERLVPPGDALDCLP